MSICRVPDCSSTETTLYIGGHLCAQHSPWAANGRPDPATLIDASRTEQAMRRMPTPLWARGGVEVDKDKPGGYVSRQKAQRIAAERDQARGATP